MGASHKQSRKAKHYWERCCNRQRWCRQISATEKQGLECQKAAREWLNLWKATSQQTLGKTPRENIISSLNGRPKETRMQWVTTSSVPMISLTSQYNGCWTINCVGLSQRSEKRQDAVSTEIYSPQHGCSAKKHIPLAVNVTIMKLHNMAILYYQC